MSGICFELHFPSRRWMISEYSENSFVRYIDTKQTDGDINSYVK